MVVIEKVDCKSFFAAVLHTVQCTGLCVPSPPSNMFCILFGGVQPNIYLAASNQLFIWPRPAKFLIQLRPPKHLDTNYTQLDLFIVYHKMEVSSKKKSKNKDLPLN